MVGTRVVRTARGGFRRDDRLVAAIVPRAVSVATIEPVATGLAAVDRGGFRRDDRPGGDRPSGGDRGGFRRDDRPGGDRPSGGDRGGFRRDDRLVAIARADSVVTSAVMTGRLWAMGGASGSLPASMPIRRTRATGPDLSDDILADDLDSAVKAELLPLAKPVAETVARHLVATGQLIDDDPAQALEHAHRGATAGVADRGGAGGGRSGRVPRRGVDDGHRGAAHVPPDDRAADAPRRARRLRAGAGPAGEGDRPVPRPPSARSWAATRRWSC